MRFTTFMIDTDLYKAKQLYPFQEETVKQVLQELRDHGHPFNLLYQLPTGGGKTVIFSAIAKQYIEEWKKKVLILTHRIELSIQTSHQLLAIGVQNKIINSGVKPSKTNSTAIATLPWWKRLTIAFRTTQISFKILAWLS